MAVRIYKGDSGVTRQAKKSFNNKLKRKNKTINPNKINSKVDRAFSNKFTNPYLQKFCDINNIEKWNSRSQSEIKLDEKFSLFDNPNDVLTKLLKLLHNAKTYQKFPTFSVNGRISFGSLYLFDNLCWEIGKNRRWTVQFKGINDADIAILGNLKSLHLENAPSYQDEKSYMINETVGINRRAAPLAKQKYKEKSTEITDMVQQGIRDNGKPDFKLPLPAYQAISSSICEHFDNIYEHEPDARSGYLCGFYNKDLNEITILVFNFGATIKESFDNKILPSQIRNEIDSVINNHKNAGFLRQSKVFTEENAMTLLALQEGVSSKITYDPSRGFGIMDYIEHCFNLSRRCKICIISGKTAIKIDNKYSIGNKFFIDRERRMIAFNDENDIYKKPDRNYVRNIAPFFPGVIIETKIPLGE